jgi:hypothetical protein
MAEVGEKKDPTERIAAALERIADVLDLWEGRYQDLQPCFNVSVVDLWGIQKEDGSAPDSIPVAVVSTPDS